MKSKHFYNFVLGAVCLGVVLSPIASVHAVIQTTDATYISESGSGSTVEPSSSPTNAALTAQIADLLAQVAALQSRLAQNPTTTPSSTVTPRPTVPTPAPTEPGTVTPNTLSEQAKARIAIREANTLVRELRNLILDLDNRNAAVEPRKAYTQALKLISEARRHYVSKRYSPAYASAMEAQTVARRAINNFNQLPAPIQCPMIALICADGAEPIVDSKCNATCPAPAPVACTMDAKICPDGSSVGRVAPSCNFAACPTPNTSGGAGGGGGIREGNENINLN